MKENLKQEFEYCLKLREENNSCTFGGVTKCEECGVPYLLYKLLTGKVLHGDMERLKLVDWKKRASDIDIK